MKVRTLLRLLKRDGWELESIEGSHHQFVHPARPGKVTVAYSREGTDIGGRMLNTIFKQAGWKK